MEIEKMKAGAETDLAIALAVMGWETVTEDEDQPEQVPYHIGPNSEVFYPRVADLHPGLYPQQGLPPYSTSIAAAWLVEEKISQVPALLQQYVVELANLLHVNTLQTDALMCYGDLWRLIHATPEQRCKAALKAASQGGQQE
jgi:hypothetical protein